MGKVLLFRTRCYWFAMVDGKRDVDLDHETPCGECNRCAEWLAALRANTGAPDVYAECVALIEAGKTRRAAEREGG